MKCQAFIEYPSVLLAVTALKKIHGVVLKDKPLIVVSSTLLRTSTALENEIRVSLTLLYTAFGDHSASESLQVQA